MDKYVIKKTINNVERVFLKSPEVLKKAKEHYGCELDGVELEN